MAEYKQKLKKNPQFKYNSANIANLNEYNELWRDFPIKHIKAPSNAAAVATTQSAICRLVCEGAPQQPQSGIHLAKKIIKQAKSIICWNSGSDPNSTQESPKRRSVIVTSMEGAEEANSIGTLNRGSSDKIHSENLSLLKRISTKQERSSISDNNNTTTKSQLEERIQ
ncbi:hypothetical protein MJO28_015785 [Puccinia striiformis f. sp. tritici]|uniref:Uncharacterized protein n=1 Tax=Puccinia striiformis f. sp. tritici TaxID=168172 RepID=A0ACC0DPZ5_9BASI|nr:hypothetical protein MJO29_015608 [Puccinia striiformis f. sp. tritici]KAI7936886.1 hypothetical protein MJO28_015785 [Puccinia striiformis f. sp. tritici]